MKKLLFFVPIITIFVVIVCAVLISLDNKELKFGDYLVDSTDAFIFIKTEKILNNKKELKELSKVAMKIKTILYSGNINVDIRQISVVKKFVKNLFLIHMSEVYDEDEIVFSPESIIIGADTGIFHPIAGIVLQSYFEKEEDGIAIMRHKKRRGFSINEQEKDVFFFEDNKIFIFSFSRDSLKEYKNKLLSGKKNEKFVAEYMSLKNKYIIMAGDLSDISGKVFEDNKFLKKINHFKATFEYDVLERKFVADIDMEGEGEFFLLMGNKLKNGGLLKKYVDRDDIYFSNKDMKKLLEYYLSSLGNDKVDYRKTIYNVFGYDVLEAASHLGKEIIIKFTDNGIAFVGALKNGEYARNYLLRQGFKEKDGVFNILGLPLEIDKNIGFFNIEPYDALSGSDYIKESSSIYSNMNIGRFGGAEYFMGVYAEVEAVTQENNMKLQVSMTKNDMAEFLTRIIEVMN